MSRRRALDWLLIVALAGSWAVLFARGLGDGLRTERGQLRIGVSSARSADTYPRVLWSGWDELLQPGDSLEALDGEDLVGASALRVYDRATRAARARGSVTLTVDRSGMRSEARIRLDSSRAWWALFPLSAAFILTGVLLLVCAPGWHLVRRNLVAQWCFAVAVTPFDRVIGPAATAFEAILPALLFPLGMGLIAWNAQEFTLSARPVPWLHRALAVGVASLGLASYAAEYLVATSIAVSSSLVLATWGVYAAVTAAGLARAYLRSDLRERRQIRWVVLGFFVTLSGVVMGALVAESGGVLDWDTSWLARHADIISRALIGLSALGVPAGIFVSVFGYHWLDVDRVISATASYSLVGFSVVGVALAVLPSVAEAVAPAVGIEPAAAQWLLTMGLVGAAIPVQRFLRPRLERRIFADRHQRMLGFERLRDEIGGYASVEELARLAVSRIDALLEPEAVALYVRDGARFAPSFVRGRAAPAVLESDSLLVRVIERRRRPLLASASELDPFDRAAIETLGVELVIPVLGPKSVAAFACLGRKRSGDIYTDEEIAEIGSVTDRCTEVALRLDFTASASALQLPQVFRRERDFWTLASAGTEIHLRDMRGLHYLATLLREPGREFHASDLVRIASSAAADPARAEPELALARGLGDAGEYLDARARVAYRARLQVLGEELGDAERSGDLGRLQRASEERELLLAELSNAARDKRASSHSERARVAVTKAIKAALEQIAARHPELGAHLSATVRRGYFCAYAPDPRVPVEWEL